MAKAKKSEASEGGGTKKEATEAKKAATPPADHPPAPKATKATAPTTKASASTTKAAASTAKPAAAADKPMTAGGGATKKMAAGKPAGAPASPAGVPLIDTSLAAATAAQFVMNRAMLGGTPRAGSAPEAHAAANASDDDAAGAKPEEKRESSTFKQLKAGLNKPAGGGLGGIIGNMNAGKKGNTGFGGGNQQAGRNQTFGADVNRAGVPRRTGG